MNRLKIASSVEVILIFKDPNNNDDDEKICTGT